MADGAGKGPGRARTARADYERTPMAGNSNVSERCPALHTGLALLRRGIMFSGYDGEVQIVHYASGVGTRDATSGCGMT